MSFGKTSQVGTYLLPSDGSPLIYFDCVTSETVVRDADITEFPVEQGANISDHYRVKLSEVHLEVFVSQEPINPLIHPEGSGFFGAQTLVTPTYPSTSTVTTVAKAIVNPVGSAASLIGNAFDSTVRPVVMNSVLQYPTAFDSLQLLLERLDALRAGAVPVIVVTASQIYAQMMLGKCQTMRDKDTGSGAKVSLEFKRIITVSTLQVAAPKPVFAKDSPTVNKGAQQPTSPGQQIQSALYGLGQLIKGAVTGAP